MSTLSSPSSRKGVWDRVDGILEETARIMTQQQQQQPKRLDHVKPTFTGDSSGQGCVEADHSKTNVQENDVLDEDSNHNTFTIIRDAQQKALKEFDGVFDQILQSLENPKPTIFGQQISGAQVDTEQNS